MKNNFSFKIWIEDLNCFCSKYQLMVCWFSKDSMSEQNVANILKYYFVSFCSSGKDLGLSSRYSVFSSLYIQTYFRENFSTEFTSFALPVNCAFIWLHYSWNPRLSSVFFALLDLIVKLFIPFHVLVFECVFIYNETHFYFPVSVSDSLLELV